MAARAPRKGGPGGAVGASAARRGPRPGSPPARRAGAPEPFATRQGNGSDGPGPWHARAAQIVGTRVGAEPGRVVAITLVVTLLAAYGASTLEREPGFLSVLPDSPQTDAFFRSVDHFENTEFTFYVFEASDGDLIDAAGASELLAFRETVASTPAIADRLSESGRGSILDPFRGPLLLAAAERGVAQPERIDLSAFAAGLSDEEVKRAFAAFYGGPLFLPADLLAEVQGSLSRAFDATPRFDPGWRLAPDDATGDAPLPHLDVVSIDVAEDSRQLSLSFRVADLSTLPAASGGPVRYVLVATNPNTPGDAPAVTFALGASVTSDGAPAASAYLAYLTGGPTGSALSAARPVNGTARIDMAAHRVEATFERAELVRVGVLPLVGPLLGEEAVGTTWMDPHVEVQQAPYEPLSAPPVQDAPPLGGGPSAVADRWPDEGAGRDRLEHRVALPGLAARHAAVVLLVGTDFGGDSTANQRRIAEVQEAAYDIALSGSAGSVSFIGPSATWTRVEAEEEAVQARSGWALAIVAVILAVLFRRLADVAIALASLGMVLAWTFGFAALVGFRLNVATSIAPFILIGVGVDYSIHTLRSLGEGRRRGLADGKLVIWTLALVGTALVLATVTTMAGFLSNLLSAIPGFRAFGVLTAMGILFALIVNVTFAPAARLLVARRRDRRGDAPRVRGLATVGSWRSLSRLTASFRRAPRLWVAVAIGVALAGAAAFPALGTSYSYTGQLPRDSPIAEAYRVVNEQLALHSERAFLLVEGDVATGPALRALDEATRLARSTVLPGEFGVESLTHLMRQASNGASWFHDERAARLISARDADGDGLPDVDVPAVIDRLRVAFPVEMGLLAHETAGRYDATSVILRSNLIDVEAHRLVWHALERAARPLEDVGLRATATGLPVTEVVANDAIIDSVKLITGGVIAASLVALTVVYRRLTGSWTLGSLVTAPVVLTLGWLILVAWALGMDLNAVTSIVGAVLVGLGVDYSIHYAHRYVEERRRGLTRDAAHDETLASTGVNLGAAVLTTIGSLAILLVSPAELFIEFGVLLVVGLVMALGAALLVMPPLLEIWEGRAGRFPAAGHAAGHAPEPPSATLYGAAEPVLPLRRAGGTPRGTGGGAADGRPGAAPERTHDSSRLSNGPSNAARGGHR